MSEFEQATGPGVDLREALFNDRAIGPAAAIQLPREAVTRLHGLVVDLDANILKPNHWFPPAATAEAFLAGITPVLERHPVLRHAEVRHTGRWLHLIVWFNPVIELRSATEQQHWAALHRVLKGSLPSDAAAPVLHALTRPLGSINSKTGAQVRVLKEGTRIAAEAVENWAAEVRKTPFEALGLVLFGQKRTAPCPYCQAEGSFLDLGELVGMCYGECRRVARKRLFEPFFRGKETGASTEPKTAPKTKGKGKAPASP
jgi:hypothetical protein